MATANVFYRAIVGSLVVACGLAWTDTDAARLGSPPAPTQRRPRGRPPHIEKHEVNRPLTVAGVLYRELTRLNIDTIAATSLGHLDHARREAINVRGLAEIAGDLRQLRQDVVQPSLRWRGDRTLRREILAQVDGALALLEQRNGAGANARLAAAAGRAEREYGAALGAKLARYGKRKAHHGKYALEAPGAHRSYVGNMSDAQIAAYTTPIPTKKRQTLQLLWEVFRQLDHQLDTEYGYKLALEGTAAAPGLLTRLGQANEQLAPLAEAQRRHAPHTEPAVGMVDALATRLAEIEPRLKATWISQKQLAQRAVEMTGHLLHEGRFGPAQSLVALARSLLEVRAEAVNRIIDNLEKVRREDLRQAIHDHNTAVERTLANLNQALTEGYKSRNRFSKTLDRVIGGLKGSREPDHELLYPVLIDLRYHFNQVLQARTAEQKARTDTDQRSAQRARRHIKKHYDAAFAQLDAAQRRVAYAMGLYDFMVAYRECFKGLRLAGWDEERARTDAFERTFEQLIVQQRIPRRMGERPSQDYQRWRIKTYQAVFEPPQITNPSKDGPRRIENPRFGALSLYFELCDRNDIATLLASRRALPGNRVQTRRYLRELHAKSRERILAAYPADPTALNTSQREQLEQAITQDYGLELTELLP